MTLIEATRAIQSNLEKLDAIAVKLPLAGLLKRADQGEDISPEIRRLFKDYPRAWQAIQEWLASDVQGTTKKDFSLPGEPSHLPDGMKEYRCPIEGCTQRWFQQRVGQQIPICETHGIQLQPVQETATHE